MDRAGGLSCEGRSIIAAARERAEIAGLLHDSALPHVIVARYRLEDARRVALAGDGGGPGILQHLDSVDGQLADALEAIRTVMTGASPLPVAFEGLRDAIDAAIADAAVTYGLDVDLHCSRRTRAFDSVAPLVYRFTLEALRNVGKHAATTDVRIDARIADGLQIDVQDRGGGFRAPIDTDDVQAHELRGFGLSNSADIARQGGGTLSVRSTPGHGALVRLHLPVT